MFLMDTGGVGGGGRGGKRSMILSWDLDLRAGSIKLKARWLLSVSRETWIPSSTFFFLANEISINYTRLFNLIEWYR